MAYRLCQPTAPGLSWRWYAFRLTASWPKRTNNSHQLASAASPAQPAGRQLSQSALSQPQHTCSARKGTLLQAAGASGLQDADVQHPSSAGGPPVIAHARQAHQAKPAANSLAAANIGAFAASSAAGTVKHVQLAASNTAKAASAADSAAAANRAAGRVRPVQPGQVVQLTCSSLALGGSGVCRLPDGFVVFCERALPGEELEAQITKAKRGHAFATKLKTLRQHDHAVRPLCAHFGPCGGCTLQSLSHSAQLAVKQAQVEEVMARIACLGNLGQVLRPIAPCGTLFHYRNKMEFSFSGRVWQPAANASTEAEDRQGSDYSKDFIFHAPTTALASQHPQPQRQSQRSPKVRPQVAHLGLHRPGYYDQILPIQECWLQDPHANVIMNAVAAAAQQAGLQPYDPQNGSGFLQHVTVRRGSYPDNSPQFMVVLASAKHDPKLLQPMVDALVRLNLRSTPSTHSAPDAAQHAPGPPSQGGPLAAAGTIASQDSIPSTHNTAPPGQHDIPSSSMSGIISIVNAVSRPLRKRANGGMVLSPATSRVLWGAPYITERLCGLEFDLSATSFFQTNTRQAEVLYNLVADAAGLRADCSDTVLDLYCGTGTIGLTLAGRCRRVVGVEVSAAAVADARRNAERNGIQNACFLQGDVGDVATGRVQLPSQPDVIITDPARAGMEPEVVAYLQSSGARTIVYVSCNPATQARDLAALSGQLDSRYAVHSIQPVDMFPHTAHVECIAVLQLRA